jgi:hypothetical protein
MELRSQPGREQAVKNSVQTTSHALHVAHQGRASFRLETGLSNVTQQYANQYPRMSCKQHGIDIRYKKYWY